MAVEATVERIFKLYDDYGKSDYLGENVTQIQHMVQCAMLAEEEGFSDEVILGALFHDIGHLLGLQQGLERMVTDGVVLGAANHDVIGSQFLREQGLPEDVCSLVKGHVDAKRYLVCKDAEYRSRLSDASKLTLVHQGGPMDAEEAAAFEASPHFTAIIRMRKWDELGKDPTKAIQPLSKYRAMCRELLASRAP
ncbi:2-amino-1-hydroxyethylphosphonate dioxygenase (glycine-forming)-like [Diadema antillarum]|uniref:2-amino-1-hydroxyethylphosphonate dioxygenase (glycine-forming)-like n=1 Tax=Diadema antillarum TaxID=105358 RepID=UPI003A878B32